MTCCRRSPPTSSADFLKKTTRTGCLMAAITQRIEAGITRPENNTSPINIQARRFPSPLSSPRAPELNPVSLTYSQRRFHDGHSTNHETDCAGCAYTNHTLSDNHISTGQSTEGVPRIYGTLVIIINLFPRDYKNRSCISYFMQWQDKNKV